MMKKHILTIGLLVVVHLGYSQQESHRLKVKVLGKISEKGNIKVNLYNPKVKFLKESYKVIKILAKDFKGEVLFTDIPKGNYAIFVEHDENNNDKLDKNFIGMPKEAMGCSNGAKGGMFGPPKFKEAQFNVQRDTTIYVNIKKIFQK